MIADTVQIITSSVEEPEVREISLRSVHGKYLIRLLDKSEPPDAGRITPHGTIVRLKLRQIAKDFDVLSAMRRWIIVPSCKVTASISNQAPVEVGYQTPKLALEATIREGAGSLWGDTSDVKIVEKQREGCTLAYALQYSKLFKEWSFVQVRDRERVLAGFRTRTTGIATCVEGISVDANTPGFNSLPFVALVNAQGVGAPRTNVARSSLEETPESEALRRIVYRLYFEQIHDEATRLNREEGYSQTWATRQIQYIAGPIVSKENGITNETLHQEELLLLPMFLIERNKKRSIAAASDLKNLGRFWTVQSELMSMVERLVRESPAEVSAAALIEVCKTEATDLPQGEVVSNLSGLQRTIATSVFEPQKFINHMSERRVDIEWAPIDKLDRWHSSTVVGERISDQNNPLFRYLQEAGHRRSVRFQSDVMFGKDNVEQSGLNDYIGVRAHETLWIFSNNLMGALLKELSKDRRHDVSLYTYSILLDIIPSSTASKDAAISMITNNLKRIKDIAGSALVMEKEFFDTLSSVSLSVFDPFARSRRNEGFVGFPADFEPY